MPLNFELGKQGAKCSADDMQLRIGFRSEVVRAEWHDDIRQGTGFTEASLVVPLSSRDIILKPLHRIAIDSFPTF